MFIFIYSLSLTSPPTLSLYLSNPSTTTAYKERENDLILLFFGSL